MMPRTPQPARATAALVLAAFGAWPAGAASGAGLDRFDAQLLKDAARAVQAADLVVEAVAGAVALPAPDLEIAVTTILKGQTDEKRLPVDISKAPVGRWPRKGESRIFCLVAKEGGGFELASYHASILPAVEGTREAIRRQLSLASAVPGPGLAEGTPGPGAPRVAVGAQDADQGNPFLRPAATSDTVLVGALTGVGPEGGAGPLAGNFAVEAALLGYGAFKGPVAVRFAARGDSPPPGPGRYLLFLAGSRTGEGFVVVEAVRLSDAASEAETKRLALEAISPRTARLTTIQATVAEWQDAWNARDIARCILCYSRESRLRRRYASGGASRRELERQISGSQGTVGVSIESIRIVLAPTSEGARETAEVEVTLTLSPRGGPDAREHATMRFVRETGEWLILEEGF